MNERILSIRDTAVLGLAIVLSALSLVWLASLYAWGFAARTGADQWKVWIFLLAGPMSALPAALLSFRRPVIAGIWLMSAGMLGFVLSNNLSPSLLWWGGLDRDVSWQSAATWIFCGPMLIVGAGSLVIEWTAGEAFFGIGGLIIGGGAGFLGALWGVALVAPRHALLYGAHGLYGLPVGALAGCVLGVRLADRITVRIQSVHPRLPLILAVFIALLILAWVAMELFGIL